MINLLRYLNPFGGFNLFRDTVGRGVSNWYSGLKDELTGTGLGDADLSDFGESGDLHDRAAAINAQYSGMRYSPTTLDVLGYGLFGDTSSRDYYYQQVQQDRDQALNDLREAQHAETYNSEDKIVQRMKNAGLNPDLQGIGNGSQASIPGPNETPIDFATLQAQSQQATQQVLQLPINMLTTAMSICSGIQQMRSLDVDMGMKEMGSLFGNAEQFAQFVASRAPVPTREELLPKVKPKMKAYTIKDGKIVDRDEVDDYNNGLLADEAMNFITSSISESDLKLPFRSKYAKHYAKQFNRSILGPDGKETVMYKALRQEMLNKLLSENKKTAQETSSQYFDIDPVTFADNLRPVTKLVEDLSVNNIETMLSQNKALQAQYSNDYDYQTARPDGESASLGTMEGLSAYQQADRAALQAELDKKIDEAMKLADQALAEQAEKGKKWAGVLRLLLPFARTYLTSLAQANLNIAIHRKTDSKGNTTTSTDANFGM